MTATDTSTPIPCTYNLNNCVMDDWLPGISFDNEENAILLPIHELEKPDGSRRVHFDPIENRKPPSPPLFPILTEDICSDLWYRPSELTEMKLYSRNLMATAKEGSEDTLGLDRFTWERIAHKKKSNRFVLRAQHENVNGDPEFLRMVSRKCSYWIRNVSHVQGYRTYCEVYGKGDELGPDPWAHLRSSSKAGAAPRPSDDLEERRVRPRTTP